MSSSNNSSPTKPIAARASTPAASPVVNRRFNSMSNNNDETPPFVVTVPGVGTFAQHDPPRKMSVLLKAFRVIPERGGSSSTSSPSPEDVQVYVVQFDKDLKHALEDIEKMYATSTGPPEQQQKQLPIPKSLAELEEQLVRLGMVKIGPVQQLLPSKCGYVFDQYVRDVFGYHRVAYSTKKATGEKGDEKAAVADFDDLWKGRKLRLLLSHSSPKWHVAKVKGFQQITEGPLSLQSSWKMTLELCCGEEEEKREEEEGGENSFTPGDWVEAHGLQKAQQHNGQRGIVLQYVTKDERYKVEMNQKSHLLLKAANLTKVKTNGDSGGEQWTRTVHRMHPATGGVLLGIDKKDATSRISFEWLDAPEPPPPQTHTISIEDAMMKTKFESYTIMETGGAEIESNNVPVLEWAKDSKMPEFVSHLTKLPLPDFLEVTQQFMTLTGIPNEAYIMLANEWRKRFDLQENFFIAAMYASLVNTVGTLYQYQNNWQAAIACAEFELKYVLSNPNMVDARSRKTLDEAYSNLAYTYLETSDLQKASRTFKSGVMHLQRFSRQVAEVRTPLDREKKEWIGSSQYMLLEDGTERWRTDENILRPFQTITPAMLASSQILDGCELEFPNLGPLPPLPDKAINGIRDTMVKETLLQIANGDFGVEWLETKNSVELHFFCDSGPLRHEQLIVGILAEKINDGYRVGLKLAYSTEGTFRSTLTDDAKFLIAYRAAQLSLKCIYKHIKSVEPWEILMHMRNNLTQKKRYFDAYDASTMYCSLMLQNRSASQQMKYEAIVRTGESLEALAKFLYAARVYHDGSKLLTPSKFKVNAIHNAGLAYKRNGNYEKAEELYVQSLHCAMTVAGGWQQWQLNDDDETNIIQSMTTNYDAWKEELRDGRSDRVDQNYAEKAFVPFLCLLSCAGFGTKATGKCKEFVDRLGKKSAKLILKAQYLSRTAAKKKLAEALSNADVSHFRSVLQDAVKPNCSMTIDTHDPGAKTRLQAKKSARREARDFVGTNFGFVSSKFFLCAMCDKSVAERRQCPCMTVTYCGRECQVAHWKAEHKNVCPNQKKKKQDPDKKHESTD